MTENAGSPAGLLALVQSLNNAFAASLDLDTTLETGVREIKEHLHAEAASLFLIDIDTEENVCQACSGPVDIFGMRLPSGEGIIGRTLRERAPLIVDNVSADQHFSRRVDEATGFKTLSLLCAPMIIQGVAIGVLEVVNKLGGRPFSEQDRMTLSALAATTAMAVHNARQASDLVDKEAVVKASKAKTDFVSSLSHELRAPLNTVLGFAQLLESDPLVEAHPHLSLSIGQIRKGGKHLLFLVDEILDLAKIEAGKLKVHISEIVAYDAMEECLGMIGEMARERGISVHNKIGEGEAPIFLADAVRFKQVILNLLTNAIKYNVAGGKVIVSCAQTGHGMLRFSVADNGSGIPSRLQQAVFQPFTRLSEDAAKIEGTGIGLSISQKLVDLMNGVIGFESENGVGSTFWVDFPLAHEEEQDSGEHRPAASGDGDVWGLKPDGD
ncbi:GAF domain-containing sensor histidine kinase [Varunaivibrio sulfuroxidans]|uniref:GAF domain-containing sensor histidine kinase n=1 Tax=Varunaivibrio sulfuroxidans TaxID=1773489 RepID=UPI001404DE66|nr:GAF domain-containing sensor histidine kinase [Varunaivibrio sulfuroxidans]WES30569.1 GAF domain-containing sensor histidine kinase [Varunaivibrio sulfuroxidans]